MFSTDVTYGKSGGKRVVAYCAVILVFALIALLLGGVAAKYVFSKEGTSIFAAKEFYFTSNFLEEEGAVYVLNSDATTLDIVLRNSIDELRCSDDAVAFTANVTGGSATLNPERDTLAGGAVSERTITLSGLAPKGEYTVSATGSAGYAKTISATFKVSDGGENVYKHLARVDDNCVVLTVWAQNVAGTLNVGFPAGCVPDNTDPALSSVANYSGGQYAARSFTDSGSFASTYSSRTYRFFLSGASSLDVDTFTVVLTDSAGAQHVADEGTPA